MAVAVTIGIRGGNQQIYEQGDAALIDAALTRRGSPS
jgi:hypothetical protein